MTERIAAGGLLWRTDSTSPELALVHRKKYSDWTLPKGKPEPGETLAETAVREVKEETGTTPCRGALAGVSTYGADREKKTVVFWHMFASDAPALELAEDVDEVEWMTREAAEERLTHDEAREVVQRARPPRVAAPGAPSITRWKAPERLRLTSDVEVAKTQLSLTLARATSAGEWSREAFLLLESAEAEARSGDLDNGWKYLHEAKRLELFGLDMETLSARKESLAREAASKLGGWRKEAVANLLAGLDNLGATAPIEHWRTVLYEAQKTRDEHSDNVYFRNRLLRKQMMWISGVLCALVVLFIVLLASGAGSVDVTGKKLELGPMLVAMNLGAMAACLSALITFATSTTQLPLPTHLANVSITLTRPLIGAVSGAAALLLLKSGGVTMGAGATPWIAPFLFGFSERVVVGALKPKE
jgi:8-oxo-dGTP diphosphatase